MNGNLFLAHQNTAEGNLLVLQQANTKIISKDQCVNSYSGFMDIASSMLCATEPGSCVYVYELAYCFYFDIKISSIFEEEFSVLLFDCYRVMTVARYSFGRHLVIHGFRLELSVSESVSLIIINEMTFHI